MSGQSFLFKLIPKAVFNDDVIGGPTKLRKSQVMLRLLEGICSAVEITYEDDRDCFYGFRAFLICFNNQVFNYSLSNLHCFVSFS